MAKTPHSETIYNRPLNTTKLRKDFPKPNFDPGASNLAVYCWYFVSLIIFRSGLVPFSSVLVFILKLFGAQVGRDVRIKPSIFIRYPWKLRVGDHSWLADCYLDNLDDLLIGSNVCISQQAMILTGNHDYTQSDFHLFTRPVVLEDGVWIASRAVVCPGVRVHSHAVLQAAAIAHTDLQAYTIYRGSPAIAVSKRTINYSAPEPVYG